jgi:hypothetical protein
MKEKKFYMIDTGVVVIKRFFFGTEKQKGLSVCRW